MKTYPQYDIVSTVFNGDRCTVTVEAKSSCGPKITAKSTVTATRNDTTKTLERAATDIAARNLGHENDIERAGCIRRGHHKGHQ